MNDALPASDIPRVRTGPAKPGPWRIADIVDGRKLRIQLTAAALDNGSDPIAQRKRALKGCGTATNAGDLNNGTGLLQRQRKRSAD